MAEAVSLVALAAVLVFAVIRPRGLPEVTAALPAAVLVLVLGVLPLDDARAHVVDIGPTVLFLAGVLALAHLCDQEGLFRAAGELVARRSRDRPIRLFGLVAVMASVTTAVLSLDATVVLLTPVVFATAARTGADPRPHVHATAHLANSASLLLPVSNLTNLLALSAAGLSFLDFAGAMALPWIAAIVVEYVVLRSYYRADLRVSAAGARARPGAAATDRPTASSTAALPRLPLAVVVLALAGFALSGVVGVEPFWVALVAVAVLVARRILTRTAPARAELADTVRAMNPLFLVFVLSLSIVVEAAVSSGFGEQVRAIVPPGDSWVDLLVLAAIGAVLANLVNNLPAVMVLAPLVASSGPVAVLAVLIGVNIGPNLTYVGSLATLLWRRILHQHDEDARLGEFTRLGALTVPLAIMAGNDSAVGSVTDGRHLMRVLAWVEPATWPAVVDAAVALPHAEVSLVAVADPAGSLPERPSPLGSRSHRSRTVSAVAEEAARMVLDGASSRMHSLIDEDDPTRQGPGTPAADGRPPAYLVDTQVLTGRTERVVVTAAQDTDVLVVARDGDRSRLGPRSLGREARFVVDHAPCTVLLVWPEGIPPLGTLPPLP